MGNKYNPTIMWDHMTKEGSVVWKDGDKFYTNDHNGVPLCIGSIAPEGREMARANASKCWDGNPKYDDEEGTSDEERLKKELHDEKWRKLTEDVLGMLSRDTSTWIVATPERLPVEQALSIGRSLSGFGVEIKGYILNRIFSEDVCAESEFLRKKREHQLTWRDRLIKGADREVRTIHEIKEDATTKDRLVTIARTLYGQ